MWYFFCLLIFIIKSSAFLLDAVCNENMNMCVPYFIVLVFIVQMRNPFLDVIVWTWMIERVDIHFGQFFVVSYSSSILTGVYDMHCVWIWVAHESSFGKCKCDSDSLTHLHVKCFKEENQDALIMRFFYQLKKKSAPSRVELNHWAIKVA